MSLAVHRLAAREGTSIQPRAILFLVVIATFLANLEVGLVTVALPTLGAAFDVGPATVQWVPLAYQLVIVGTLIPLGRLVDVVGGRTLYLSGMATILVAALLAAASPHVLWLILARGLLGLGAAMLLATGQALIAAAFSDEDRGRALGFMHMAVAGGLMSGPAIGGLLVSTIDWRAIFLVPVPLALGALWWGWHVLPVSSQERRESLDITGAALIFIGASSAVIALTRLTQDEQDLVTGSLIAVAVIAVALFILVERRHPAPLVELSLLNRWSLTAGLLAAFLTFVALASNMFLIPFTLQDLMGHSAARAGLVMMVVPLVILPMAPLAGTIADRLGSRLPATAGLATIVAAIIGMSQFRIDSPLWFPVLVLMLYGIGAGLFQAPNNSAVLGAAPGGRIGTVSGMLALARNLGQVVGIVVASTVWATRQAHYEQTTDWPNLQVLRASLSDSFLVLAAIGLIALFTTLLRRNSGKDERNDA